jgi:hypothetical protein
VTTGAIEDTMVRTNAKSRPDWQVIPANAYPCILPEYFRKGQLNVSNSAQYEYRTVAQFGPARLLIKYNCYPTITGESRKIRVINELKFGRSITIDFHEE